MTHRHSPHSHIGAKCLPRSRPMTLCLGLSGVQVCRFVSLVLSFVQSFCLPFSFSSSCSTAPRIFPAPRLIDTHPTVNRRTGSSAILPHDSSSQFHFLRCRVSTLIVSVASAASCTARPTNAGPVSTAAPMSRDGPATHGPAMTVGRGDPYLLTGQVCLVPGPLWRGGGAWGVSTLSVGRVIHL